MDIQISKIEAGEVLPFRQMFLEENTMQFILDKAYAYGWADVYAFYVAGRMVGYASVWGKNKREDRDTIFEFYLEQDHRRYSDRIFRQWVKASQVIFIEAQTNDPHLSPLFFRHAGEVQAEAILFRDSHTTNMVLPDTHFTRKEIRKSSGADEGDFMVIHKDEVVATGGLMLNYNFPYADVYMGVDEKFRDRGFGSYIVQELKKHAYAIGRVPAARCDIHNTVSLYTLLKAGFEICGYRVGGKLEGDFLQA